VLSELREEFWDIAGSADNQEGPYKCLPCKVAKNPSGQEREVPMPPDRVTASKPFQVTGINFARHLHDKGTPHLKECYIALFTRTTIHAVHLEL